MGRGTTQGLVTAFLSHQHSSNAAGGEGDPRKPLNAVLAGGTHRALVKAFLMKYYGQGGQSGRAATAPAPQSPAGTASASSPSMGRGTTQGLVTAFLSHQHSSNAAGGEGDPRKPLNAVLAGGTHRALDMKYSACAC